MRRAGFSLLVAVIGWMFCASPALAQAARLTTDPPITGPDTTLPIGTTINVSGTGCRTSVAFVILVVNVDTPNEKDQVTVDNVKVSGGSWSAKLTIPPDTPVNQRAQLDAGCGTPDDVQTDYDLVDFTVGPPGTATRAGTIVGQGGPGPTTGTTLRGGGGAGPSRGTTATTGAGGTTSTGATTTTSRSSATTAGTATTATTARTSTSTTRASTAGATTATTTGTGGTSFASTGVSRLPWVAAAVALLAAGQCLTLLRAPR